MVDAYCKYLPYSAQDEIWQIYCTCTGMTHVPPGQPYPARPIVLSLGTIFFLYPGLPHWYAPDRDTGWDEYWVGFRGPYPDLLLEKGYIYG